MKAFRMFGGAAAAAAAVAVAATPAPAHAEVICVRVTVIGPVIGTMSTGYTCTMTPLPTFYREVIAPLGPIEVIVEVVTPAADS